MTPRIRLRSILGLALTLAAAPLLAQRDARIPDPDPELERRSFQVADGFEVNLWAADPMLAKPIEMNFDAAGRLWVACSALYPQIKPGQTADDKIVVLEDTKGTGKADRATVFAEGLLIPTGLEPGDGGVYVANSTELLHLMDTDGDGKADRRRVVLSGFGTEDTHHILHTLRWGPDGMLYFNQSTYIHSHIETPYGPRRLNGGGVWQFRPETTSLEVFARGWINPWGQHWDRWGQTFVTDGAGGEGVNYVIPGAAYAWAIGVPRILQGLNPGSPKYCGCEVLSGRHLPDNWQGNLVTNDFRGHRVCRFVLREDGSGFSAQEKGELIKTTHDAFRPVDVKMGPDGAIYIADWYNPIIQHGEVDFRDPRRDHAHGRIWRVTAKGRPLVPRPRLVDATTEELLADLKAPEQWTRHFAKRVLKERGSARVVPVLAAWVEQLDPADPDHEHQLLEALWTYQSLDVVEPELLATLLRAEHGHPRAAAARVAGYWQGRLSRPLDLLATQAIDARPLVRLEAVRALGKVPDAHAVEAALKALDLPMDKFLDYGLWLTVRDLEPYWLPALQKGQLDVGDVRHLTFLLQASGSREALGPLVSLVRSGKIGKEREESVLAVLASLGGPGELGLVFDRVVIPDGLGDAPRARLLDGLAEAARQRKTRPAGDVARVALLLGSDSDAVRTAAARLAGLWQVEAARPRLVEYAGSAAATAAVRLAAVEGLGLLGGKASRDALDRLAAGTQQSFAVRRAAVVALADLDVDAAAARAADVLDATPPGTDPADVFTVFVQRKSGPLALAKALAGRKLPVDVAKVGLRTARTPGRESPPLVDALMKAGGLTGRARELTPAEMTQFVADVRAHGDPARGEAVYRRPDLACFKCHAIAGAGGQVGPDLVSIGASAQVDYLVESILVPNKAVKENYHSLNVVTTKGTIVTGIKVRETATELVLRDAEDREVKVPVDQIDERNIGGSLMPEGLADSLTRSELVDLVRFLSELGKVGPYAVSKARLVRRWQALTPSNEAYAALSRTGLGAVTHDGPGLTWAPAYSTVAGVLPLTDVPGLALYVPSQTDKAVVAFVRCELEATTAGPVRLRLNAASGLTAWLDQAPLEVREELVVALPAGRHTLTFAVNRAQRSEPLRCELDDVPGSPARAQVVGGK
jgi:putative heme-binding domain-containing protein